MVDDLNPDRHGLAFGRVAGVGDGGRLTGSFFLLFFHCSRALDARGDEEVSLYYNLLCSRDVARTCAKWKGRIVACFWRPIDSRAVFCWLLFTLLNALR